MPTPANTPTEMKPPGYIPPIEMKLLDSTTPAAVKTGTYLQNIDYKLLTLVETIPIIFYKSIRNGKIRMYLRTMTDTNLRRLWPKLKN